MLHSRSMQIINYLHNRRLPGNACATETPCNRAETAFNAGLYSGLALGEVILCGDEEIRPRTVCIHDIITWCPTVHTIAISPCFNELRLTLRDVEYHLSQIVISYYMCISGFSIL